MERTADYMGLCNPGTKYPIDVFEKEACRACVRPECKRSAYKDTATKKKIEHQEKIAKFVDPTTVPQSPLSVYPEESIHRAEIPGETHLADDLHHSVGVLTAIRTGAPLPTQGPPTQVDAPVEAVPQRPADPWEAPKDVRYIDYREVQDPKKDPWSAEYEGPRSLVVKPGGVVNLGGKRTDVVPQKANKVRGR